MLCDTMRIPFVGIRRWLHSSARSFRKVSAAGKADALPHAARQLLGIGVLEAVEADQVDRLDRAPAPLGGGDALRLET